jgi:hypothetical protein
LQFGGCFLIFSVLYFRLHDGSRLTQRFNLTHTVETIRQFVASGELLRTNNKTLVLVDVVDCIVLVQQLLE